MSEYSTATTAASVYWIYTGPGAIASCSPSRDDLLDDSPTAPERRATDAAD
jgi:hypothetical protein